MQISVSPQEKISLFKSIFTGRTDVFAQYWISRDGMKKGWFPVHTDRTNTAYRPLSDAVIEDHLRGNRAVGVYPLLQNNTSWFVAADFDGTFWQKEVNDLLSVCREYSLPAYVERSRSGNGAHVWWFFEAPYLASKSRVIFLHLLTLAGAIDPLKGEHTFDRIFPHQDYLSGKGIGNLIALPLQGSARKEGNSVFVDPEYDYTPHLDQWHFLQSVERIPTARLEELHRIFTEQKKIAISMANYTGSEIPITISSHLVIPKTFVSKELANFLGKHLNFFNTEYAVKQRMGLSTFDTERYFRTIEKDDERILLPRGFQTTLLRYLQEERVPFTLIDERYKCEPVEYSLF